MTQKYFTVLTEVGLAAIQNMIVRREPLKLSKFEVGDGAHRDVETLKKATSLVNKVTEGFIAFVESDKTPGVFYLNGTVAADIGGFTATEVVWRMEDGQAFAFTNYPPAYKALPSEGAPSELPIRAQIIASQDAQIIVKVDPTIVTATRDYVNQRTWPVDLGGSLNVYSGTQAQFKIKNKSDASTYSASVTVGTVTLTDDVVNVDIPASASGKQKLTITRDGIDDNFELTVNTPAISAPVIASPASGATNVVTLPTVTLNPFSVLPAGFDTHASTQYQFASDNTFQTIILDSADDAANLTSLVLKTHLPISTKIYVRARFKGPKIGYSDWSETISFTTADTKVFELNSFFQATKFAGKAQEQRLVTGMDFTKKGLALFKSVTGLNTTVYDTIRDVEKRLVMNGVYPEDSRQGVKIFHNDGITVGTNGDENHDGNDVFLLQLLAADGFVDIVEYSGNDQAIQEVLHSLKANVGAVIVKCLDYGHSWTMWHNSFAINERIYLESETKKETTANLFPVLPSSTKLTVGAHLNDNGRRYIAYIVGNNPSKGIVCGKFRGTGIAGNKVDMGFTPKLTILRAVSIADNLYLQCPSILGDGAFSLNRPEAFQNYLIPEYLPDGIRSRGATSNVANADYVYIAIGEKA